MATGESSLAPAVAEQETLQENSTSGPATKNGKSPLRSYLRLLREATLPDHILRCIGLLSAIAFGAAMPLMTIVFGHMVDDLNSWGSGDSNVAALVDNGSRNALWLTWLFLGCFACVFISVLCLRITALRSSTSLRLRFIRALISQDIQYMDSCSAGTVGTLVSTNAELVEGGIGERITIFVSGLSMLFSAFVVAFVQSWKLTLVVALGIPLSGIAAGFAVVADSKINAKVYEIYAQAAGLAEEALSTTKIVAAFGASGKLQKKYDQYLRLARRLSIKQGPLRAMQFSVVMATTYLSYGMAWFYGTHLLSTGGVSSGGKIIVVLNALLLASASLNNIVPSLTDLTKAAAAVQGLYEIIDHCPSIDALSTEGKKVDIVTGCLALKSVSFSYPSRPAVKVLDDVSLEFEAGKTTAIVGPSGSGKSTILALLCRWFDPDNGSVSLDGVDTRDINLQSLRSQIGVVQQEPTLFRESVYTNVAYGLERNPPEAKNGDSAKASVHKACKVAYADQFIRSLPQGYDTIVGDRGDMLSGGQKQRVAIARSIVSEPPILLLDEATSALDPQSERIVQKALEAASLGRTTIVVAHRLSTIQKADKIVVMRDGRIAESGTHEELLAMNGTYRLLVGAQCRDIPGNIDSQAPESTDEVSTSLETSSSIQAEKQMIVESGLEMETVKDDLSEKAHLGSRRLSMAACVARMLKQEPDLWPLHLATLVCCIMAGALFPCLAVAFSKAVTVFQIPLPEQRDEFRQQGFFWGGMFVVIAAGVMIATSGMGYFATVSAAHLATSYRSAYFAAMLKQDATFFETLEATDGQQPKGEDVMNSAGAMTSRLSTNPQRIQDLVSLNISFIIVATVTVLGSSALAIAVAWKLALVGIAGGLIPVMFSGLVRLKLDAVTQSQRSTAYRECARFAGEAVGAIRTVSSLTLERKVIDLYSDRLSLASRRMSIYNTVTSVLIGLTDSIFFAVLALVFWYGLQRVAVGETSVESFFIVFIALIFGGQSAGFLFGFTLHVTKAHDAASEIISLLDSKPPIQSSIGRKSLEKSLNPSAPAIEFRDVTFHYPTRPSIPSIKSLSFSIDRGAHVGIVGASGSGKSTVIALIERFYDPSLGTISINGSPLQELSIHEHRARVGYVSQSTTLYEGSIEENITLGLASDNEGGTEPEASETIRSRVVEACRSANIHDFVASLPDGYATAVGARGVALSGGQRQRLAIARALIREPEILLFDEATSSLDSESERAVQQAIEEAARGDSLGPDAGETPKQRPTTVVVAHRLATVRNCDTIFVLHEGRLCEKGSHAELMRLGGRYRQMVLAQSLDSDITGQM